MISPRKSTFIKSCTICGDPTFLKKFGAISCQACAAFFRRTIALKKTYSCKNFKICFQKIVKKERLDCRFCRLAKCIMAGMKPDNVRMTSIGSNSALFDNHDDILNRLVYFRKTAYFNRMQTIMRMVDNIDKHGRTNFITMESVIMAEGLVYSNYLESTGLFNLIEPGDKFQYIANTMRFWILFDIGLATIRNGGISKNLIYFLDETFRELNEDQLTNFYRPSPSAKNIDAVARAETDFFQDFWRILRKICQYRFDEVELALLIQLLLLKIADEAPFKCFNTSNNIELYKKEIFIALHKYYKKNGIDYSLRLGDLIFVFIEFQNIRKIANELRNIMYLNKIWPENICQPQHVACP